MNIYFFDTETTGNTGKDYLCQLAIKKLDVVEPVINATFKPIVPIPIECTMIHGISNKMVADRPYFDKSPEYKTIKALFEDPNNLFIAHNAAFDIQILKNDGIVPANTICTFKVIRILDEEGKFPMHKLQYLRYALDMELDAPAHDAWGDVLVLEQLFLYELEQGKQLWHMNDEDVLTEMIRITHEPIAFRTFTFGKYKDKTIAEVATLDRGYLKWLYDQKKQSDQDETDWLHTLEKFLQ